VYVREPTARSDLHGTPKPEAVWTMCERLAIKIIAAGSFAAARARVERNHGRHSGPVVEKSAAQDDRHERSGESISASRNMRRFTNQRFALMRLQRWIEVDFSHLPIPQAKQLRELFPVEPERSWATVGWCG